MPMRYMAALICLLVLATPVAAKAFRSIIGLYVVPITATEFEVIEDGAISARDFWCAAANYARAAGLDGVRKRMYVETPRGPSKTSANRLGVVFTTAPGDDIKDTPSSYSVTVTNRGENLAISHAHSFCWNILEDEFGLF